MPETYYLTSETELTSIANAIRAKYNSQSAISYPQGFIDYITDMPNNPYGQSYEYMETVYDQTIKLSDTNFSSWSPSTTRTTIKDPVEIKSVAIDLDNYEYQLELKMYTKPVYKTSESKKAAIYDEAMLVRACYSRRTTALSGLLCYYNESSSNYITTTWPIITYYNSSGTIVISNTSAAITVTTSTSFSGNNLVIKTPYIYAQANNTYMTAANFSDVDAENTNIKLEMKLYRLRAKTSYLMNTYDSMLDFYRAQYPDVINYSSYVSNKTFTLSDNEFTFENIPGNTTIALMTPDNNLLTAGTYYISAAVFAYVDGTWTTQNVGLYANSSVTALSGTSSFSETSLGYRFNMYNGTTGRECIITQNAQLGLQITTNSNFTSPTTIKVSRFHIVKFV